MQQILNSKHQGHFQLYFFSLHLSYPVDPNGTYSVPEMPLSPAKTPLPTSVPSVLEVFPGTKSFSMYHYFPWNLMPTASNPSNFPLKNISIFFSAVSYQLKLL